MCDCVFLYFFFVESIYYLIFILFFRYQCGFRAKMFVSKTTNDSEENALISTLWTPKSLSITFFFFFFFCVVVSLCDALPALLLWVKLYFSQNGYRIFSLLLLFYIFHNYYVLFYFCLWFIIESFSFLRSLFTTPTWLCVRTVFVVVIDSFDKSMFYHVSECWMRKKSQNNKQPKKALPKCVNILLNRGLFLCFWNSIFYFTYRSFLISYTTTANH